MPYVPYCETKVAGTDLSNSLYRLLAVNSAGFAVVASSPGAYDTAPKAVCAYPVLSGQAVSLHVQGFHKVEAGAAVRIDAEITCDSLGRAVTANSGDWVIGKARYSAAAGDIIEAVFVPVPYRLVGAQ